MNTGLIRVDVGFYDPPTSDHDCREAMWSTGKECKKCPLKTCYRNGWTKKQVLADNKCIVEEKLLRRFANG